MDQWTQLRVTEALQRGRLSFTVHASDHKSYREEYAADRDRLRAYENALLEVAAEDVSNGNKREALRMLGAASEYATGTPSTVLRQVARSVLTDGVAGRLSEFAYDLSGAAQTAAVAHGEETPQLAWQRAYRVLDWLVRTHLPMWIDLAARLEASPLTEADMLRSLPRITSGVSARKAHEVVGRGTSWWNIDYAGRSLLARLLPNPEQTPRMQSRYAPGSA